LATRFSETGDRLLVVVAGVDDDGLPVTGAPPVVDPCGRLVDLLLIREVLGEVLPGAVEHRHERDAAAPLGLRGEEVVVDVEAAHDVLRQVDAVAAEHELAVAHELLELRGGPFRRR
jgi:hypothetical protein